MSPIRDLLLAQPSRDHTLPNLSAPGDIPFPFPFPVKETPISLRLYNVGRWDFDRSDLGSALSNAYTSVENIIEVAGDGEIPASALPFEVVKEGAYVLIANDNVGAEGWKLRWGDVKDVLWGLREDLIGGRHLGNMVGAMVYREPGHRLAG